MGLLKSIFGREIEQKKDGRATNGQNLTPELRQKGQEASAEVRAIQAQTKQMRELAKFYKAQQDVQSILNPVEEQDDLSKFFKMLQMATNVTTGNNSGLPSPVLSSPTSQPQPSAAPNTESEDEIVNDQWQKFYDFVLAMPPEKFEKLMFMLSRV
jgi:hypothetical protein